MQKFNAFFMCVYMLQQQQQQHRYEREKKGTLLLVGCFGCCGICDWKVDGIHTHTHTHNSTKQHKK